VRVHVRALRESESDSERERGTEREMEGRQEKGGRTESSNHPLPKSWCAHYPCAHMPCNVRACPCSKAVVKESL